MSAQYGIVKDDGQIQWLVTSQNLLADHARLHPPFDDGRSGQVDDLVAHEDVAGIPFGLQ